MWSSCFYIDKQIHRNWGNVVFKSLSWILTLTGCIIHCVTPHIVNYPKRLVYLNVNHINYCALLPLLESMGGKNVRKILDPLPPSDWKRKIERCFEELITLWARKSLDSETSCKSISTLLKQCRMILSVNETKGSQHSNSVRMSLMKLGDLFQKSIYRNDKTAWIRQFWPNAECNVGKSHKCMFYLQQHNMKHSDLKLGNSSPKCRKLSL